MNKQKPKNNELKEKLTRENKLREEICGYKHPLKNEEQKSQQYHSKCIRLEGCLGEQVRLMARIVDELTGFNE